jgi:hypothetical protein
MHKEILFDLLHDKLSITALGIISAVNINPKDLLASNTWEARMFTDVLLLFAAASIGVRIWRRWIAGRMESIELHRKELELEEERIQHEVVQKNVDEIVERIKTETETTFQKKI